ncbi:hypothetical protein PHET_07978 [Paragonimus heterotremus]|uniref:Progesterone immunomodulatory binding factor 1 n=1 Tax=Paragonimus heterotremus TaxID=100268 RepID=A0A8J4T674_9TREM|nr:hypothetical protein PHET_07978 [Paragonimus heterotremus]
MQVATQVNVIQTELHKSVVNQKCLRAEKEALASEMAAVRQLMSTLVTDHLIYKTNSEVDSFEIDVGAYSQLRGLDLEQLSSLNSAELSVKQYVQLQVHRLVILFAKKLVLAFSTSGLGTPTADSLLAIFGIALQKNFVFVLRVGVSRIRSKRRQHSSPPLLHNLASKKHSSVSAFRNEPSSNDVGGVEQNKTPTACSDHELMLLGQQVKLLQDDKEYLLNEIENLSSRLASTEHDLVYERARTERYSKEINELRETMKAEQCQKDEEFARRLERQAEELSGLARMEFIKMRSVSQETHNAELAMMRQQRNQTVLEANQLRVRLDQAQQEIESQRRHLRSLLKDQSRSNCLLGVHDGLDDAGYSVQERLVRAMVEVENAQAAREDALLKVEKLTAQLDASKKSYYELEFKSRQERAELECKLQQYTTKLEIYDKLEKHLDEALEDVAYFKPKSEMEDNEETDLFEHIKQFGFPVDDVCSGVTVKAGCVILPSLSARRLEHAMKLAKQVTDLKRQFQKLLEQLDTKNKEIESIHQRAEKLSTIVSLSGQPVDTLAYRLAEREAELKAIRDRLSTTEERLHKQTAEQKCLLTERNNLANDLNRLLNRRQTLTKLREQLTVILDHSTNKTTTAFGSRRLCCCPCVCGQSCQSTAGRVRKRIISFRKQLPRTQFLSNFQNPLSSAPYDTDRS